MTYPVVLIGMGALFSGMATMLLVLISAGQGRMGVTRTIQAASEGYRIAAAASGQKTSGPHGTVSDAGEPAGLRSVVVGRLAALARTLTRADALPKLGRRLDQAGNPAALTVASIMEYKGICAVACGLFCLVLGAAGGPGGLVLWTAGGAAFGFFCPNFLIMHLAQKRQEEIRRTLPDIIDTLVVTVEAGLGFEAAIAHLVRSGRGPMQGEFARMLHEMQLGEPRVSALRQVAARTTVTELKAFASSVIQATSLGIPLGGVLRQQSAEMRVRRQQRAEELAQKVPVKILFPMVLCIFPALFVVILGPGAIRALGTLGGN